MNKFMVACQGEELVLLMPPKPGQKLSKEEALELAAWLVCVSQVLPPHNLEFGDVLDKVQGS